MTVLVLLTVLALTGSSGFYGADADQSDNRLDPMFERLKATHDQNEAAILTRQIWQIWRHTENQDASVYMARGITAMSENQYPAALAAFDEVVRKVPKFAEGWNARATLHYLMDNFEASIRDIEHTLSLEPRHFGAISGLGLIYLELGNEPAALKAFEKALEINPHLTDAKSKARELRLKLRGKQI